MIACVKLRKNSEFVGEAKEIYISSFPEYERVDFDALLDGKFDDEIYVWFDKQELVGLSCVCKYPNLLYLKYLAVAEGKRNLGYGSKILKELATLFPTQCFALNIEYPVEDAERYEEKVRRKNFYLRNGLKSSNILFDYMGEPFLPLFKGEFDKKGYMELMTRLLGDNCDNFREI